VERCDPTVNEITLVHTTKNDAWTRDFSNAGKIMVLRKLVPAPLQNCSDEM